MASQSGDTPAHGTTDRPGCYNRLSRADDVFARPAPEHVSGRYDHGGCVHAAWVVAGAASQLVTPGVADSVGSCGLGNLVATSSAAFPAQRNGRSLIRDAGSVVVVSVERAKSRVASSGAGLSGRYQLRRVSVAGPG